ncbi:MAG: N-acetylglucosamine-6-phosphate deacetylase [Verrucomicrobiae bacterium]|nr:N-acetylglucosamine-6-phosphate deacetylase [Verrucomicrobiae bacterium]
MTSQIANVRVVFPGEKIATGTVRIEAGQIAGFNQHPVPTNAQLLTPGLIDLHTHGIGQNLYERSPQEIATGATVLPQFGTTCVLPTLYRVMNRESLPLLAKLAAALPASMPGFHMEGPFLALPGAGAATIPGDLAFLEELLKYKVRAMSVSPDTPNILPVIRRLRDRGVTVFMTHTRASAEQSEAAIAAGATHATHFYDVFPIPAETEPGVRQVGAVEAILADKRVSVDFIADGVHVHPLAIKCALAGKTWAGVVLITDSNIGAGLPAGVHDTPWGFKVRVQAGDGARHAENGTLAGSALTMNVGMKNLLKWLPDLPAEQVWAMGTLNPARVVGLENKGRIAIGADADLVLWDEALNPVKTWVGGELVYDKV